LFIGHNMTTNKGVGEHQYLVVVVDFVVELVGHVPRPTGSSVFLIHILPMVINWLL
jgi:hypothetical protein